MTKLYRCAGCGAWLDEHEVADGSHQTVDYVYDGGQPVPIPALCGPVHEVDEEEGR